MGTKFWEVVSPEHGLDPSGEYVGPGDQQQQLDRGGKSELECLGLV